MSFAWAEYLELAEALFRERATFANDEACCRAAISRAYYAAFCAARNYACDNEGLALRHTARDHQIVFGHYDQGPSAQHRAIGWDLGQLRQRRNQADYDDSNLHRADALVQNALQQARQVFTALRILGP